MSECSDLLGCIVRPKKPDTIEMNKVRRVARAPDLGFPSHDRKKFPENFTPIRECRYIDKTGFRILEEFCKFRMTSAIDRAAAGNRFGQDEPIFLTVVDNVLVNGGPAR